MRITFLLPGYPDIPSGGHRVVYLYGNLLIAAGHEISVVHAGRLRQEPQPEGTLHYLWTARKKARSWRWSTRPPHIRWEAIDPQMNLVYLRGEPEEDRIPEGDAIFATSWETAEYVSSYSRQKGVPFYLIQGWETWSGPEDSVARTWLLPFHKVVVSRWLLEKGRELGARDVTLIPNAVDHDRYRVLTPPLDRPPSIVTPYHPRDWKGAPDALEALRLLHEKHPQVPVIMFSQYRPAHEIPRWIAYQRNPPQETLVSDIYNRSSIILDASRSEGWGLIPAEAMACGCAFVGTNIDGFLDYAVDGETALLSPPGDAVDLFQNLVRVVEHAELRHRLQQSGMVKIRQFNWERSGRQLQRYIEGRVSMAP